jgi:hypothetical protein
MSSSLALDSPLREESAMPQVQLPVFPAGAQTINADLAFECRDHQVTYFTGHLPVIHAPGG